MERDVAIIGMACVFPKAPDLVSYWRNLCDGVDAITDVPPGRWDPVYYDPDSTAPDRFYARRGGFIDEFATFDAAAFGIMPIAAQGAEPDQLLALQVAVAALADAGYAERAFARARTDVVLGRGNYLGPAMLRLVNITRGAQQLVDSLRSLLPDLSAEQLLAVKKDFQSRCGVYGADTAIGLVPNLVASRIANRLDLGGSASTVDAACASTLVAVDHACRSLHQGSADLAIAGGVHLCHDPVFWSVFSQLGALSRSQQIRPFDRRADGLLIGEGVGMVVLKRLADARRDDDRIYAVIRGIGVASDGRDVSLMTPRVEGQMLALSRAWVGAGLEPHTIGMLEAHGTATAAGDAAEIDTLSRFFGAAAADDERVPVGSVKSMIGHAMPASGAAGLIKAALAVYHGVRPPTLHCDEPNPALSGTRFRPARAAEQWDAPIRRAAVNSFGFGGINAHVILDADHAAPRAQRSTRNTDAANAVVVAAPTQAALLEALHGGSRGGAGSWRAAIFDPTPARIALARTAVEAGRARHGRDGIHFSPGGLIAQGGKVAFLFPGIEAEFAPDVADIARHFGLPVPDVDAADLEHQGRHVVLLSRFLMQVADRIGLRPDVLAGHSIGEWSGMLAAGMFDEAATQSFVEGLRPGTLRVAEVRYIAAGAGGDRLAPLIAGLPDVTISHDNCIHQSILCAAEEHVPELTARLKSQRILYEVLPFRSGFHSPALADHADFYVRNLARLKFTPHRIPLWSATRCAPYPAAPEEIRALFAEHLVRPVRFRELIEALYADGVRVFVQMGTGSLPAFVDDVLAGRPHHALSLLVPRRPGITQLQRAGAALYVEGADIDIAQIGLTAAIPRTTTRQPMALALGVPLLSLDLQKLRPRAAPAPAVDGVNGALAHAFDAGMRELLEAQSEVLGALAARPAPRPASLPATERVDKFVLSLATYPELIDHALVPQPPGWPIPADSMPAVPMTMSIALIREAAQRLDPRRLPVAVENVVAKTWLRVDPPVEVSIVATRVDAHRIHVRIDAYLEGTVVMADRYPAAPAPAPTAAGAAREFPITVEAIYSGGWMFHGPQYQGIVAIGEFGTTGMSGTLRALPAKGALLDAAGQLPGLHLALLAEKDRLALPVKIARIDYYADDPRPGTLLECTVAMRHVGWREVRADFELVQDGGVYLHVTGWEDWRFQTGGGIWELMREPARASLAQADPRGFTLVENPGWSTATIDYLTRRYLSAAEADAAGGAKQLQRQHSLLLGRIAAKDAVRQFVFARDGAPMFPIEVAIAPDVDGRPRVTGPFTRDLRVSIAHTGSLACAVVAEGVAPGVDIEKIEPRSDGFVALSFEPQELLLLPDGDRDEWLTRLWSAKEAAGKALGMGLAGNPKSLQLTKREGERLLVADRWIETCRMGEHVVAWTKQ
ncbi:MAG: beta-ketoacyl synthase N-terminal-like domain-containing protein [Betaproteobacteria bacterium]